MTDDEKAFYDFCEAGAAFLRRGLEFAKQDSPELYADVLELVEAGRAKVVLVTEFAPSLRVVLRVVDQSGNAIGDVFVYQTSSARSKLMLN